MTAFWNIILSRQPLSMRVEILLKSNVYNIKMEQSWSFSSTKGSYGSYDTFDSFWISAFKLILVLVVGKDKNSF